MDESKWKEDSLDEKDDMQFDEQMKEGLIRNKHWNGSKNRINSPVGFVRDV